MAKTPVCDTGNGSSILLAHPTHDGNRRGCYHRPPMGYSYYELPDGREAGYGVTAVCDQPGCAVRIDRGLGCLCGFRPDGHRGPEEPGCGRYFCGRHEHDHGCTNPECEDCEYDSTMFPPVLAAGHEGPHRQRERQGITSTGA